MSKFSYLNTDLDLSSSDELSELAGVFESRGLFALHVTLGKDGIWQARFETVKQHDQPEPNIMEMVSVIESLADPERATWSGCSKREFNIGYDCGTTPHGFHQGLSTQLLGRIAAVNASLRVTLYPIAEQATPAPFSTSDG